MDSLSNRPLVRRVAQFTLVVAIALGLTGAMNVDTSAESSGVKVIGHTLLPHANGVMTLGVVSAFTTDTTFERNIDEATRTVRDTGMIVDVDLIAPIAQGEIPIDQTVTLSDTHVAGAAESSGVKVIGRTLVTHANGVMTLGVVSAFTIDTAQQRDIDEATLSVRDTGMIVDVPSGLVD